LCCWATLAALILWVWVLGKYYPGSGLDALGLRSANEITEDREALEAEDLAQMLDVHNERRRRRGKAEMTVGDLELQVQSDVNEQRRGLPCRPGSRGVARGHQRPPARPRAARAHRDEVMREFGGGPAAEN